MIRNTLGGGVNDVDVMASAHNKPGKKQALFGFLRNRVDGLKSFYQFMIKLFWNNLCNRMIVHMICYLTSVSHNPIMQGYSIT